MCDKEAIHRKDDDLGSGYDNLAINDYSPTPVNSKLIVVQPRFANTEILSTSSNTSESNNSKKTNMVSRLSSSSDSIEEVDISQETGVSKCNTKYYVIDYKNGNTVEESTFSTENEEVNYEKGQSIQSTSISVFDEGIMASTIIKNPVVGIHMPDLKADLHRFLLTPPPKNVLMTCQINKTNDIDKTLLFTNFIFSLQMSLPDCSVRQLEVLMVAHANKNPKNFAYNISSDPSEVNFNSDAVVGQLRSSFLGKRFNLFSKTQSTTSTNGSRINDSDDENFDSNLSMKNNLHHIGVIFYKGAIFGSRKPRRIDVAIPIWDDDKENYNVDTYLPKERKEMIEETQNSFIRLENVEPRFDEDRKCYTLDFGGRAKLVSVKNFALTMKVNGTQKRVYQFGKCKSHYIVDFTYPLCPLQAFAIGLSSCQRKFGSE